MQKPIESQKYLGAADQLIRNANLQYRLAHAKEVAVKQFEVIFRKVYFYATRNMTLFLLVREKASRCVNDDKLYQAHAQKGQQVTTSTHTTYHAFHF